MYDILKPVILRQHGASLVSILSGFVTHYFIQALIFVIGAQMLVFVC